MSRNNDIKRLNSSEPNDSTNVGSYANSHRNQFAFRSKHEPDDGTNFGSHAFPALIRISVKQNS